MVAVGADAAGTWADRLSSGDRRSVAAALTAVENDTPRAREILREIHSLTGNALVVGFTGPPGVGKSTLVSACIRELRKGDLSVAVVAVDPSSPISGGAVLGDRVRMLEQSGDSGVFIRSLASRGQLGGLSYAAGRVIDVLDAAGKDIILVETVGTGQSEIEIAEIAQIKVVVVQPGAGDGIQALKAGVLEIADILVVNKSDLPHAGRCVSDLRQMVSLRTEPSGDLPIFLTMAQNGEGIAELVECIRTRQATLQDRHPGIERMRRLLVSEACKRLRRDLLSRNGKSGETVLETLCQRVMKAELTLDEATKKLLSDLQHVTAAPKRAK
jgi:LAO/AO transport system kinase